VQIECQAQASSGDGSQQILSPGFEGVDKPALFTAVRASGRLEIDAPSPPRGWQKADWSSVPAYLQDRGDRSLPALCFRVAEPEAPLTVTVRRHDLADALKLRVTKAAITSIFSPGGAFLTSADLTVESVAKTTLRVLLPPGAQLIHASVNSVTVPVVRDGDAWLFNVSPGSDQQTSIQLVYAVTDLQHGSIALAGPVLGVPMENVSWRVMIPAGFDLRSYKSNLVLNEQQSAGSFGVIEYQSLVSNTRRTASNDANALLQKANTYLQRGDQQQAGEALDRAAKARALDAASNEDARVELRVLKTQQAVLGLNTRRQKLYLDNRADVQHNEQLEQAANINPLLQGKTNYNPQQYSDLLQGNTAEENSALNEVARRIVDQQLAAEPAPAAINVTIPQRGQVLTFTRSMQVDGATPLTLDLTLSRLPHSGWPFIAAILGVLAILTASLTPKPTDA
jgi:hypothetical protein